MEYVGEVQMKKAITELVSQIILLTKLQKNEEELLKSLRLGVTRQTIQNYKKLTEMIPELEELVDTGIATPTTALAIMRNLSEEE